MGIRPGRTLVVLLGVSVGFVVLTLLAQAWHLGTSSPVAGALVWVVDVNGEQSMPAFFSALMLLAAGGLLALITAASRRRADGNTRHWGILAITFVLLSLDEIGSWHEQLNRPLRDALGIGEGALWFAWVIPAALLVTAFAVAYVPFLLRLPARTRWAFVAAGVLFVAGAIGFELPGAVQFSAGANEDYLYVLTTALEELLEMAGASLFVATLLSYLPSAGADRLELAVTNGDVSPPRTDRRGPHPRRKDRTVDAQHEA